LFPIRTFSSFRSEPRSRLIPSSASSPSLSSCCRMALSPWGSPRAPSWTSLSWRGRRQATIHDHPLVETEGFKEGMSRLDADLMAARALLGAQVARVWQNPERTAAGPPGGTTASEGLDHLGLASASPKAALNWRKQGRVRKLVAATKGAGSARRGPTRGGPSAQLRSGGGRGCSRACRESMYRNGRGNNARAVSEKLSTIDSSSPDLSPLPATNDKAIATGAKTRSINLIIMSVGLKLKATVESRRSLKCLT